MLTIIVLKSHCHPGSFAGMQKSQPVLKPNLHALMALQSTELLSKV